MKKNEKLASAMSFIDEKYVKEAEFKMKKKGLSQDVGIGKVVRIAASIAVFIGLGLFLFWPLNSGPMNVSAFGDSEYYPLIEKLESYRYNATKKSYNNNFGLMIDIADELFRSLIIGDILYAPGGTAPEEDGMSPGEYVEVTDNQVLGVIEADIIKTTDKYIFYLSGRTLKIYSIAGADSQLITSYSVPIEADYFTSSHTEMYLSTDCTKVIIIDNYMDNSRMSKVGIISIDVTNVEAPYKLGEISIDGKYNTSRLVGDKLLMISEFYFNPYNVDYSDPTTYVPTVTRDGESGPLLMDEIYAPDTVSGSRYSVVASIDIDDFVISGANGLLNFTENVYVSEENVYVTRRYNEKTKEEGVDITETKSDIIVLGYKDGGLDRQVITVSGSILNQYSMDEREGYLRVVTSTYKAKIYGDFGMVPAPDVTMSASLFVIDLESGEKVASVENFAPEGDEVTSVRFDGDDLYVCTAIIVTMTDPVYFFDLSDYSNITYTDTGIIDGFSTSLINLGEGFLLGIGREDWRYNKVEVYEQQAGEVKSVSVYQFDGEYSTDYKGYFINREENLFGFAVIGNSKLRDSYVLLHFDGYELSAAAVVSLKCNYNYNTDYGVRAILRDGMFYILTDCQLQVVDLSLPAGDENQVVKVINW